MRSRVKRGPGRQPIFVAVAVCLLAMSGVSCGGGGGGGEAGQEDSAGAGTSEPVETEVSQTEPAQTDADQEIVKLVTVQGGRLSLDSGSLFSDVDFEVLQDNPDAFGPGNLGGLDIVAATRAKLGARLERAASEAGEALSKLSPQADAAAEVAELGQAAFEAMEECGSQAGAVWSAIAKENVDVDSMVDADQACEQAQEEFAEVEAALEALPEAAPETSTTDAAASGEEVQVVLRTKVDAVGEAEVVQPVAPGAKVAIVLDAQNTSSFRWRLEKGCDGKLTFDVSLVGGSPMIDPAEAGYAPPNSPMKSKVPATIEGQQRFKLEVGTFTIADDATGSTNVSVFLGNSRCPDPQGGALYSPISVAPSFETLVLEAG